MKKRKNVSKIWTDERIESLRRLWNNNLSSSLIAAELNRARDGKFTRNAVIGAAHRLCLSRRLGTLFKRLPYPRRTAPSGKRPPVAETAIGPAIAVEQGRFDASMPYRRTLMFLQSGQCHYPINDPRDAVGLFYCGADADGEYCDHHYELMYQPERVRR
jgi:GcrA cell cycle regulator